MSATDPNRAWRITSKGVLTLHDDEPVPIPVPGQSLVRVHAVSINYRDFLVVDHSPAYPGPAIPGLVPCADGAGVVVSSTSSAASETDDESFPPGTKVIVHPNTWLRGSVAGPEGFDIDRTLGGGWTHGTLRTYMTVDTKFLMKLPEHLSFEEAAALDTAGGTAWNMLVYGERILGTIDCAEDQIVGTESRDGSAAEVAALLGTLKGRSVLTQGTGGVSVAAVQFALAAGAKVIATSSNETKLQMLRDMGVQTTIDYRKDVQWGQKVLELTGGKGVDHVIEVGGAGTIEQSLIATRSAGLVTVAGILTESEKHDLIPHILFGPKTIRGSLGAASKAMTEDMLAFTEQHKIHPVIGKTFEFQDSKEAFEFARGGSGVGKIVIRV